MSRNKSQKKKKEAFLYVIPKQKKIRSFCEKWEMGQLNCLNSWELSQKKHLQAGEYLVFISAIVIWVICPLTDDTWSTEKILLCIKESLDRGWIGVQTLTSFLLFWIIVLSCFSASDRLLQHLPCNCDAYRFTLIYQSTLLCENQGNIFYRSHCEKGFCLPRCDGGSSENK